MTGGELLNIYGARVEKRLGELMVCDESPKLLRDSMAYSVQAGGKRLRPCLCLMANNLKGGDNSECMDIACALELIHTYSLIHDDLPAMDDDTLRRGKPTNHVVFGEGNAILAGDGLLTYAFEVMLKNAACHPDNLACHINAISEIAKGAGVTGMVAGQSCDLMNADKKGDIEQLRYIHEKKTGALIRAALLSGLYLCDPEGWQVSAVLRYGELLGLVFQIVDDILDVTGDPELMGKTLKKDSAEGKLTYVDFYGVEGAKRLADVYTDDAAEALSPFGKAGNELTVLAYFMRDRNK